MFFKRLALCSLAAAALLSLSEVVLPLRLVRATPTYPTPAFGACYRSASSLAPSSATLPPYRARDGPNQSAAPTGAVFFFLTPASARVLDSGVYETNHFMVFGRAGKHYYPAVPVQYPLKRFPEEPLQEERFFFFRQEKNVLCHKLI